MKKHLFLFVICISSFFTYAQTVSEEEILSIKDQVSDIVFENYVGPHTEISTREEITGIGLYLGENSPSSPSWGDKYRLFHSFQPEIPEGLDADILAILENAGVDHITNLRRIISGYLQSVYDYKAADASILAEFITYYNAIYYKNISHFSTSYKEGVLQYLSAENAGLSTHYSEWPGKSRIVIPTASEKTSGETGDMEEQTPALDTSIISQPEVVEEMRKEEDKALDTRKDMVEIREEELDEKQEVLDEKQEVLTEEKEELKEAVQEKEKELETVDEGSAEEEIIKEEIQVLEEKEKVLEEKQEDIAEEQETLDKKQDEVHKMRNDIAEDENILKKEEEAVEAAESIIASTDGKALWFVLIEKQGDPASFGTLCKITENGDILDKSDINSIRGNTAIDTGEGIAVIAGKDASNSSINVILIDQKSLELLKQSETNVYAGNTIWTDKDNLYIITRNNSDWVLGKYSYDLELLNQSEVKVHPDSAIQFDTDKLLIQNSGGTISVLSKEDLSEIQD